MELRCVLLDALILVAAVSFILTDGTDCGNRRPPASDNEVQVYTCIAKNAGNTIKWMKQDGNNQYTLSTCKATSMTCLNADPLIVASISKDGRSELRITSPSEEQKDNAMIECHEVSGNTEMGTPNVRTVVPRKAYDMELSESTYQSPQSTESHDLVGGVPLAAIGGSLSGVVVICFIFIAAFIVDRHRKKRTSYLHGGQKPGCGKDDDQRISSTISTPLTTEANAPSRRHKANRTSVRHVTERGGLQQIGELNVTTGTTLTSATALWPAQERSTTTTASTTTLSEEIVSEGVYSDAYVGCRHTAVMHAVVGKSEKQPVSNCAAYDTEVYSQAFDLPAKLNSPKSSNNQQDLDENIASCLEGGKDTSSYDCYSRVINSPDSSNIETDTGKPEIPSPACERSNNTTSVDIYSKVNKSRLDHTMDLYAKFDKKQQAFDTGGSNDDITTCPVQRCERTQILIQSDACKEVQVTTKIILASPKHQVAASKPQVAASKPQVAASKPQVPASKPQVPASKPQVPASKPQVSASKHQVPASNPQVPVFNHQVPASNPQVPASKHQVAASNPQVAASRHQVPASKPQVPASKHHGFGGIVSPTDRISSADTPDEDESSYSVLYFSESRQTQSALEVEYSRIRLA